MSYIDVGSVCSGIEAASVALEDKGFKFQWFSEIENFPSQVLQNKYPGVPNLGDMCEIPDKLLNNEINAPSMICGGTPCQAFSLAGWKKGLEDDRGNLTLKFVEIIESNDLIRKQKNQSQTIVFWENVEGVLKDKTNAFGSFLASLAGFDEEIKIKKWPQAGVIHGVKRNIAWRVIDAKYFGLPHQRRRLYVLAGGTNYYPEDILFEKGSAANLNAYEGKLKFKKDGQDIEIFREYTDCLYSAYGTKWNGNAAAYNGSLFVSQNGRLRRLTPLECERLMGFPDNYTDLPKARPTNRYKAIGNSWAVPVIEWIGNRIASNVAEHLTISNSDFSLLSRQIVIDKNKIVFDLSNGPIFLENNTQINTSEVPVNIKLGNMEEIIDIHAPENFYISPAGCKGILRRKQERNLNINPRLENVLNNISSEWSDEKIEKISRVQKRGRFSEPLKSTKDSELQLTF